MVGLAKHREFCTPSSARRFFPAVLGREPARCFTTPGMQQDSNSMKLGRKHWPKKQQGWESSASSWTMAGSDNETTTMQASVTGMWIRKRFPTVHAHLFLM